MTMRREAFLDHVKERGEYGTAEEAERAARVVLALLGAHLVGEVRAELAARLPEGYALILLNPLQSARTAVPRAVRAGDRGLDRGRHRADRGLGRRRCAVHGRADAPARTSHRRSCSSSPPATTSSSAAPPAHLQPS